MGLNNSTVSFGGRIVDTLQTMCRLANVSSLHTVHACRCIVFFLERLRAMADVDFIVLTMCHVPNAKKQLQRHSRIDATDE